MMPDKITIRSRSDKAHNHSGQSFSKLQLLKWSIVALLGLSVVIAFLLAAFVIGLLLTVPLVLLGILWFISMAWRGKIRIHRNP